MTLAAASARLTAAAADAGTGSAVDLEAGAAGAGGWPRSHAASRSAAKLSAASCFIASHLPSGRSVEPTRMTVTRLRLLGLLSGPPPRPLIFRFNTRLRGRSDHLRLAGVRETPRQNLLAARLLSQQHSGQETPGASCLGACRLARPERDCLRISRARSTRRSVPKSKGGSGPRGGRVNLTSGVNVVTATIVARISSQRRVILAEE